MRLLSDLLNILFPSACPVCGSKSDNHLYNPFCTACWNEIKRYEGPACGVCGLPAASAHASICELCLKARPCFLKAIYYGLYDKTEKGALEKAVNLLKFNGIKRLSKPLGSLLAQLQIPRADAIIPVPLYKGRLMERGFNQSALLSTQLSKNMNIPVMLNALKKIKDTPPQTLFSEKNREKRWENVKGAYEAAAGLESLNIILVDDVITTGATIRECSKVLKDAGAESITVVALARSIPAQFC